MGSRELGFLGQSDCRKSPGAGTWGLISTSRVALKTNDHRYHLVQGKVHVAESRQLAGSLNLGSGQEAIAFGHRWLQDGGTYGHFRLWHHWCSHLPIGGSDHKQTARNLGGGA